jgi:hypothetical protein
MDFNKGNGAQASSNREPNFPHSGRISRDYFPPINLPKRVSIFSSWGYSLRSSIDAAARLLLVIGAVYGLYLTGNSIKSAVANPKHDRQIQTEAAPQPAQPLPKSSAIIPADTARVEGAMAPQEMPDAVRHSPASPAPRYPAMRYEARHKRAFGGCTGQLELTGSRLYFRCPNQADLIFPVDEIAKANKDGVVLKSGEKYHFTIANQTRGQVEAIFTSWLNRVQQLRTATYVPTRGMNGVSTNHSKAD